MDDMVNPYILDTFLLKAIIPHLKMKCKPFLNIFNSLILYCNKNELEGLAL